MAAEAAAAPCTKLGRMGVGAHPRGAWRGDSSRAARRVRRPCRPSPLRMFIVERACVFWWSATRPIGWLGVHHCAGGYEKHAVDDHALHAC